MSVDFTHTHTNLPIHYLWIFIVGPQFIKECFGYDCAQCHWTGGKGQWSLKGDGHSEVDCTEACRINKKCNYASISALGLCHMSTLCAMKSGRGWTRYRKGPLLL